MNKTDHSGKVGGRRNKAGSDMTAGNSISKPGKRRSFQGSNTMAVANESKRFTKSKTRVGRKNSVS